MTVLRCCGQSQFQTHSSLYQVVRTQKDITFCPEISVSKKIHPMLHTGCFITFFLDSWEFCTELEAKFAVNTDG